MEKREGLADLSLLGGPLHRLGCRVGLVRDGTNTTALGLVLGAVPWIVLLALALVESSGMTTSRRTCLPIASMETSAWPRPSTWSTHWYWMACIPLLRFLFMRWLWRLALWCFFLWRVSRLELRLVPTHPDRAGGLGYLEWVHTEFIPLVVAISATQSASLAQDIASGRMTFDGIYQGVAFIPIADAVLFLGPLHIFSRKLWACKVKGLNDYSAFAERYVDEFDRKWLGADAARESPCWAQRTSSPSPT